MGQYHKPVNITAREYLLPHQIGCGLKACESIGGGIPAALAALLSYRPGNMPGDLGHHPMIGRWAGHRLLVVGDYAENSDIRGFDGPPLSKLYRLCEDAPDEEYHRRGNREDWRKQYAKELRRWNAKVRSKNPPFANITKQIWGVVENGMSVRFCGDGWMATVPVNSHATRGEDGRLHYEMRQTISEQERKLLLRLAGFVDTLTSPPEDLGRWPWDRPAHDLSWQNTTDGRADEGQTRVFANLTTREFYDPIAFGEQPTSAGIMRAAGDAGFSSAGALYAMLLHPKPRGGGDITQSKFPEIGRWRNSALLLTSEYGDEFPTTDQVKATFRNISDEVLRSTTNMMAEVD